MYYQMGSKGISKKIKHPSSVSDAQKSLTFLIELETQNLCDTLYSMLNQVPQFLKLFLVMHAVNVS